MLIRLFIAGLLLAHALIHVAFVAPAPPVTAGGPAWPFATAESWLLTRLGVGPEVARLLAFALIAATVGGFALAALAVLGLAPASIWVPAVLIGATASLAMLVVFFHPWLIVGVGVDVALIAACLWAGWTPAGSVLQD